MRVEDLLSQWLDHDYLSRSDIEELRQATTNALGISSKFGSDYYDTEEVTTIE